MDDETQAIRSTRPLSAAAVSALQRGNKIEAIKIVRHEQQLGLRDAKDAVEDYVRTQPALQGSIAALHSKAKLRAIVVLVAAIAVAWLVYWYRAR